MPQPPANCPRCESEQKFVPKMRETEHRWQELVIRCTVCRWESVVKVTTPEIETISKKLRKMAELADHQMERFGQPTASLIAKRRTLRKEQARLIGELAQEMRAENGPATHPDAA